MKTKIGNALAETRGIIVHGCNNKGVMGAGIAAMIKKQFPKAFTEYRDAFENHETLLGSCTFVSVGTDLFIINAITQTLGGQHPLSYDAVEECFELISEFAHLENQMRTQAGEAPLPVIFPAIGAGLAGGKWPIVSAIIDATLDEKIERVLYALNEDALEGFVGTRIPTEK